VCIDASQDALRVNAWGDGGVPGLVVIHPVLPPSPEHVAFWEFEGPTCEVSLGSPVFVSGTTLVEVAGTTLSQVDRYSSWVGGLPDCSDGGFIDPTLPLVQGARRSLDLGFSPGSLALSDSPSWLNATPSLKVNWLSMPDGGLFAVTFDPDAGQFAMQVVPVPFPIRKVTKGTSSIAVFDESKVALSLEDGGWQFAPPLPDDAGVIQEVSAAYSGKLYVLTGQVHQFTLDLGNTPLQTAVTGDWSEVPDCKLLCSDGRTPSHTALLFDVEHEYLLSCLPAFDGGNGLEFARYDGVNDDGGICLTTTGLPPPSPFAFLDTPVVLADGDLASVFRADVLAEPTSNVLQWTYAAFSGLTPQMLGDVPAVAVGPLGAPTAVTAARGTADATLAGAFFSLVADAGFLNVFDGTTGDTTEFLPVLAVDGRSSWAIYAFDGGTLVNGGSAVLVDARGEGLRWSLLPLEAWARLTDSIVPDHVAVPPVPAPTSDAGVVALLTAADTLYYADITHGPWSDRAKAPKFRVAIVPQVRSTISALLAVEPSDDATYSLGYLIANGRVYRVRADNSVVWRVDAPLVVADEAVALWKDGPRVRVGFGDGSVYGLPSGARLALPIMSNTTFVSDFADVCGSTFAAARDGVYELIADGTSPVGRWQLVSSNASGPLVQAAVKLQADGDGLLVYREHGVVERLTNPVCAGAR
jgi:hypothetical protein